MPRYLVIANQTLAEAALLDAIRKRLEAGPSSFYVLVPNTSARDLAARVASIAPIPSNLADATSDHDATAHAQHRLGQLLQDIRKLNVEADGDLGDADPVKAVGDLLERHQFDEIILSTLPQPVSKWLRMDLPHRLNRRFGLPVTTITARA